MYFFSNNIITYIILCKYSITVSISIYDELFRFKEGTVEIEAAATNSDMTMGEGNGMSGDISIKGAYLNMCTTHM